MGTEEQPNGFGSSHRIVHRRAPTVWEHGFPLGNGVLGVMVWGDGQPLAFTLDRADLWDPRLDRGFMDHPDFSYAGLRRLVTEKRFAEAQEVFEERQRRDNPTGPTKIGVGRAELSLGEAVACEITLDIDRAVVEGTMRTATAEHRLLAFVARDRNLLCLRADPAPADAPMRVVALRDTGDELAALGLPEPHTWDDGSFRVWDLRSFQSGNPVAMFHWHKAAITSIEWSPHDSSSIGVSGADDQLTLWDLALEDDPDADAAVKGRDDLADLPPQLYFVHQGQSEIKELHWHAQLPGVICSTAADSFHIFKPANAGDGPTEPPEED